MDWRTQAYKSLYLEKSSKGKPRLDPEWPKCRVLSFFGNTVDPSNEAAQGIVDQELSLWLTGPESKIESKSRRDGFSLLLCSRPERVNDNDVRANFSNMPFKKATSNANTPPEDDMTTIFKRFHVYAHMGQALKRRTPYFSVVDMTDPEQDTEKTVYTGIFDTGLEDFTTNLAFTSTYLHSYKTSFGIILGCTKGDVEKAAALLLECGSSWNHQLLLSAIFFELQRQHLANIRKTLTTNALELQGSFEELRDYKNGQKPFQFGYQPLKVAECVNNLSRVCNNSNVMAEDLRIASRQLSRLKRHAEELVERHGKEVAESQANELEKLEESAETKKRRSTWDNTRCFLDLFDEIADDVELVSGAVTVNAKAATTTADEMIRSTLKQDTRWSMGLALVAMAYLPITALATIFALPVFDFKAHWRDMGNQPANWSESSGGEDPASVSPSSSPPPVMSIYFTYWISTSIALTWLTIEIWWLFSSEVEDWRWDRILSLRLLAQVAERLDEIRLWAGESWTRAVNWIVKSRNPLETFREKLRKPQSSKGVNGGSNGSVRSGQTSQV